MSILLSLMLLTTITQDTSAAPITTCNLPAELDGWSRDAKQGEGEIGTPFLVSSSTPVSTKFLNLPPEADTETGRVIATSLRFRAAGTYQIAVSQGTYIGLIVRGNIPVQSDGDRPALACAGIAKVTQFTVPQGEYTLVVAGLTKTDSVRVLKAVVH